MTDTNEDEIPTSDGVYTSLEKLGADFPPGSLVYEMAKPVFAAGKKWVRIEPTTSGRDSKPEHLS